MRKILLSILTMATLGASAQIVTIPDANFKAYLVGNTAINTNLDTEIQVSEANAFAGLINCQWSSISDLTGIEAFTALTQLYCNNNPLTTLDVSNNTALTELNCYFNPLTTLDVSNNTALTLLNCESNSLTVLDVSTNTALTELYCGGNSLTALNVSTNTALTELYCSDNSLTALDVSNNTALTLLYCFTNSLTTLNGVNSTALTILYCHQNSLTALDVSNNTALTTLWCQQNSLTTLDVSNNTALTKLWCYSNYLTALNVVNSTALTDFRCENNSLTALDVANGNNTNFTLFKATTNPNLTCIQVDDAVYSTTNWTGSNFAFDAASSFSTNCSAPCTVNIPDANFKAYLVGNTAINTNGNTEIECSEAAAYNGVINCGTSSITDLTGIEAFTALTVLQCFNNPLNSLDISANTALEFIECFNNSLSSLDVSNNTALTYLSCSTNSLTSLDVSNNTVLTNLIFRDNSLTSLDVSNNTVLTNLTCYNNPLSSLDVSANTALISLACNNNSLTTLDVSTNTALTELYCYYNSLTALNVSTNTALTELYCYDNSLTDLDVSTNTALTLLNCNTNSLTTLDVSTNTALIQLDCQQNSLTTLDVTNGNNSNFTYFNAANNPSLTCIQVDDVAYSTTNWTNIDAASSFSTNCGGTILVNSITVQGQGGATTITTQGGTLQMEATVLPMNADDATYTWSIAGVGSATISSSGLLTATADGDVDVLATANDGSGIIGAVTITISNQSVGINETSQNLNLTTYPNPTTGNVTFSITEQISNIEIYNLTGQKMATFNNTNTIDISSFSKGIYTAKVTSNSKTGVVKLIKE